MQVVSKGAAALFVVVFVVYLAWRVGDWALENCVFKSQRYALNEIDIQTDGVLAPGQIRRWAGVKIGDNVFDLDLGRIKRDLELVPSIESVGVQRVLPRMLRIKVQEREPVAQIMTSVLAGNGAAQGVVFLIDSQGYVMLPLEPGQRSLPPAPSEQYPMIVGASPAPLVPGRRVESPQIHSALRLIAAFDQSPMAGLVELRRIDVSSPEVLQVTTDRQGEVDLRASALDRQLNRWRIVHDFGARQGRRIAWLDLSVMENIPLRWSEDGGPPPPPAGTRKTSPYRKKNV